MSFIENKKSKLCKKNVSVFLLLFFAICSFSTYKSQVSYSAAVNYSLRKVNPIYAGNAIQIRRTCDNATVNIGFNSCGYLDTITLLKFVVASNPLSAITSTAAAAFSLRRLNCVYAGSAIQVRRSSDNATQDIGFTANGDLDTTSLKTFVGANSGFVTIWYDQSSNGRNATQATAGKQPRIVNSGVIERQGSQPTIRWLGVGYGLSTAAFTAYSSAACFNGVARVNTNVTYNAIVNKCNANLPSPLDFYNGQIVIGNGASYNFFAYGQTFNSTKPLSIWTYQGASAGSYNFYYNGTSSGSGAVGFFGDSGNPLVIGSRADVVTGLNGWISEVITFGTIPSAIDRQFLEWSQSQYYNISGISLGTPPAGAASAYITKWYDQSGNGNDASQATTTKQPRIINTGIINNQNGLPSICLDGTNYYMNQSSLNIGNPYSVNTIATRTANGGSGGYQRLINISSTSDAFGYLGVLSGNYATFAGNGAGTWNDIAANTPVTGVALNSQAVLSMNVNTGATGLIPYLNGTAQTAKVGTAATGTGFLIGAPYNATNTNQLWTGNISELNIFSFSLTTTRRTLIETNQSAFYNKAISGSKYTPPSATSYNLFVNGIGYTSSTDSVAGTRSSSGMGFFVSSSVTDFLKDNGDYITAGINCPITSSTSTSNLPATVVLRWENDWYVNKTDVSSNNGNLTVYFDFSDYGVSLTPGVASNYVLLYRTSPAANFTIVPSTTVSVAGDKVQFMVNASNITTNYYYTIGTKDIPASPLPIELLSIDAKCQNNEVTINWVTATESNNNFFTIEKSADGIEYTTIGKVKSSGNSNQTQYYSFIDKVPIPDYNYYRVKQTDFSGEEKYFNLVSVICEKKSKNILVYPNPSNNHFFIEGCKLYSEVVVLNQLGEEVLSQQVTSEKIDFDVSNLANGIYFLKIEDEDSLINKKIVIQH